MLKQHIMNHLVQIQLECMRKGLTQLSVILQQQNNVCPQVNEVSVLLQQRNNVCPQVNYCVSHTATEIKLPV